jgi:hypothetical protein
MTLDLSKLAPITRMRVLEAINKVVCNELCIIQDDLKHWENHNSEAGKEMVAWKDALVDLRIAVVTEGKE